MLIDDVDSRRRLSVTEFVTDDAINRLDGTATPTFEYVSIQIMIIYAVKLVHSHPI